MVANRGPGEFRFRRTRPALMLVVLLGSLGTALGYFILQLSMIQDAGDAAVVLGGAVLLVLGLIVAYDFLRPGRLVIDAEAITIRHGFSRLRLRWSAVESVERVLTKGAFRWDEAPQPPTRESAVSPEDFAFEASLGRDLVFDIKSRARSDVERRGFFHVTWDRSLVELDPRFWTEPAAMIAALERHWPALRHTVWRTR